MANFSPAPWSVPVNDYHLHRDIVPADGLPLGVVFVRPEGYDAERGKDIEGEANSALIAAAPELMEACEAALEFLRDDLDANDPDIPDEEIQELMQVGGALHLALTKARGEEET